MVVNIFPVLSGRQERGLEKQRNQWKGQASLCGSSVCSERLAYAPYEFNKNSNLHKQYITSPKKDRSLHTHTQPICLLNGRSCHQANMSRADSREWSPLQDLLYSQPGSCPLASGQRSDGWRAGRAVGWRGGDGWGWISDRLRDVEMEGKIRGQGDGGTDWEKKWEEGGDAEKICGFWMQKWPVSPSPPQVRKKQAESL